MNKKEEKEFLILNKIYKSDKYKNIIKRENPDFELEHFSGHKFGVEITEMYFSESNARVINIPNYISNILSTRNYLHKDDVEELKVGKFTIISDGKPNREIEAIGKKLPENDEVINMLCETILGKFEKYNNYDPNLGHINLIICDMENRYRSVRCEDFPLNILRHKLLSKIKNSPFREIFFITEFSDNKQYYFPLRLIYLLSECYLINKFFVENKQYALPYKDYKDEIMIYSILLLQGVNSISLVMNKNNIELLYSNYGIQIDDNSNGITFIDYSELPLPTNNSKEDVTKSIDSNVFDHYIKFKDDHSLIYSIYYEVN